MISSTALKTRSRRKETASKEVNGSEELRNPPRKRMGEFGL